MTDQFTPEEHQEDAVLKLIEEGIAELNKGGNSMKALKALGAIMQLKGGPSFDLKKHIHKLVRSTITEMVEECHALGCNDAAVTAIVELAGQMAGVQKTEIRDYLVDQFHESKMKGLKMRHDAIAKGEIKDER